MILPWQQTLWARFNSQREQQRLPHALLFVGPAGVGKRQLAEQLQSALLCIDPQDSGEACGKCDRCQLIAAGSHPDTRNVRPEGDSKVIKVDQIRELTSFLGLTSQYSGWKVAYIDPADRMNENAANALLKTLEEPGRDTLLLLVSDRPASLPATIRSRCQRVDFRLPERALAEQWLAQSGTAEQAALALQRSAGAPIPARDILNGDDDEPRQSGFQQWSDLITGKLDPVSVAVDWTKLGAAERLEWLHGWIGDQIKLSQGLDTAALRNPDLTQSVLTGAMPLSNLYERLDRVDEARRLAQTPVNDQALLESILFDWYRISRPQGR